MTNVVRFTLPTARDLFISGVGAFRAGVLDIDANKLSLVARARFLVQPYRAVEVGVVDSAAPAPTLPATPRLPTSDPVPGMEIAFAEARSGINATTTTVNVWQDLSFAGLQVVVPPLKRPVLLRASGTMSHSVSSGTVAMRIAEVSNGVDTPLIRAELGWPTGGISGLTPFYANLKPELRVPAGTRERAFRLSFMNGNTGTATVHTPGNDTASPGAPNSTWQLFMEGIVR